MPCLSEALGDPRLWIKRDDQTGLATGGNKTRKLEFLVNDRVLLDPVYSGRAAAGLIGLIGQGVIRRDEQVLFWHTGGTTGLFAFGSQLED